MERREWMSGFWALSSMTGGRDMMHLCSLKSATGLLMAPIAACVAAARASSSISDCFCF